MTDKLFLSVDKLYLKSSKRNERSLSIYLGFSPHCSTAQKEVRKKKGPFVFPQEVCELDGNSRAKSKQVAHD